MTGREQSYYQFGRLAEYLDSGDLTEYIVEIENGDDLIAEIERSVRDVDHFKTKKFRNIYDLRFYRMLMYVIARWRKPDLFIETGVMHGLTSSFILEALVRNGGGKLVSIDYPSYFHTGPSNKDGFLETLPPGKEPGWVVPEHKKNFWDLKIGKSADLLPLLDTKIDIFLHDSEHSYETMWMEMKYGWENLNNNGILIVDNIDSNTSFYDFCREVGKEPILFYSPDNNIHNQVRFGLITK